jgi:hypothetical protein
MGRLDPQVAWTRTRREFHFFVLLNQPGDEPDLAPSRDPRDEIPSSLGGGRLGWSNPGGNLANKDWVLKPRPLTASRDLGVPRLYSMGCL